MNKWSKRIVNDLISISILSDSGKSYTAINKNFSVNRAWKDDKVRELILVPMFQDLKKEYWRDRRLGSTMHFNKRNLKKLAKMYGKDVYTISKELQEMLERDKAKHPNDCRDVYSYNAQASYGLFMLISGYSFLCVNCKNINQIVNRDMMEHKGFPHLKRFHGIGVCNTIKLTKRFVNNYNDNIANANK